MLRSGDINFFVILLTLVVGIMILFFFCSYGKSASESFEQMANRLYECNWLEFPVDTQKYIRVMIMNAQRPINYHGSGIAVLNLETFAKVIWWIVWNRIMYSFRFKLISVDSIGCDVLHGLQNCHGMKYKTQRLIEKKKFSLWYILTFSCTTMAIFFFIRWIKLFFWFPAVREFGALKLLQNYIHTFNEYLPETISLFTLTTRDHIFFFKQPFLSINSKFNEIFRYFISIITW